MANESQSITAESNAAAENTVQQAQRIANILSKIQNWNPDIPEERITSRSPDNIRFNKARTSWYTALLSAVGMLDMMGMLTDDRLKRLHKVGVKKLSGEDFTTRFKHPVDIWLGDKLIAETLNHLREKGIEPDPAVVAENQYLEPRPLQPIKYYGTKDMSMAPRWVHSPHKTTYENEPPENRGELTPQELEELAKKERKHENNRNRRSRFSGHAFMPDSQG